MSQVRDPFEARFPVPSGVAWSDEHQNYGWVKKSSFQKTITYRALWTGWQASREALVIELPDDGIEDCQKAWGTEQCKDTFDCGYNFASLRHEQAIDAAGVKVQP